MSSISSLTTIQLVLALEASANLFGATCMLLFPGPILTYLTNPPSSSLSSTTPDPASAHLVQWLAALVYGLTPPLLLAVPDQKDIRGKRWIAYVTLGAGEASLMAVMLWQAFMGKADGGGFTKKALLGCVGGLMPFMLWRVWVLFARPELLRDKIRKKA